MVPISRGDRALADLFEGTAKVQQAGDGPITLTIEQGRALACAAQQIAVGLYLSGANMDFATFVQLQLRNG
jgi:hypothetical protein